MTTYDPILVALHWLGFVVVLWSVVGVPIIFTIGVIIILVRKRHYKPLVTFSECLNMVGVAHWLEDNKK